MNECFLLKVMSKFMAGMFGFFAIGVALSHVFRFTTVAFVWLALADILIVGNVFVVLLGIEGTSKFPLGLDILHFLLTRGRYQCPPCHLAETSDDDGSSEYDTIL